MRVVVLKPFPYSPDGKSTIDKVKDDEFDCRDDIADGLIAEKFVKKIKDAPANDGGAQS